VAVAVLAELWWFEDGCAAARDSRDVVDLPRHGIRAWGAGSGSGWVVVVPIDRVEQGGHFDTSYNVAVAVLAVLCRFEKRSRKNGIFLLLVTVWY
jgi:hypothetical protein